MRALEDTSFFDDSKERFDPLSTSAPLYYSSFLLLLAAFPCFVRSFNFSLVPRRLLLSRGFLFSFLRPVLRHHASRPPASVRVYVHLSSSLLSCMSAL